MKPGIVTGTDEYGMPEFREGATIKVRISDEGKSMLRAPTCQDRPLERAGQGMAVCWPSL